MSKYAVIATDINELLSETEKRDIEKHASKIMPARLNTYVKNKATPDDNTASYILDGFGLVNEMLDNWSESDKKTYFEPLLKHLNEVAVSKSKFKNNAWIIDNVNSNAFNIVIPIDDQEVLSEKIQELPGYLNNLKTSADQQPTSSPLYWISYDRASKSWKGLVL
jgi:hypothetical protein